MTDKVVCSYRWFGPRPEVADTRVEHVCVLEMQHDGLKHRCSCGAVKQEMLVGKWPARVGESTVALDDDGPYVTKTGRVLSDEDIQALADEAERGYDPATFKKRYPDTMFPDLPGRAQ